jgi:hypothetical protein
MSSVHIRARLPAYPSRAWTLRARCPASNPTNGRRPRGPSRATARRNFQTATSFAWTTALALPCWSRLPCHGRPGTLFGRVDARITAQWDISCQWEGSGPLACPNYNPDTRVDTAPGSLLPAAKCHNPANFNDRVVFIAITNYGVRGAKACRFAYRGSYPSDIDSGWCAEVPLVQRMRGLSTRFQQSRIRSSSFLILLVPAPRRRERRQIRYLPSAGLRPNIGSIEATHWAGS